jgi:hypothetical protein
MTMMRKCIYALASSFMLQLWFDLAAYAANNKAYALGLFTSFTYPIIAMIPLLLIVDEKDLRKT